MNENTENPFLKLDMQLYNYVSIHICYSQKNQTAD